MLIDVSTNDDVFSLQGPENYYLQLDTSPELLISALVKILHETYIFQVSLIIEQQFTNYRIFDAFNDIPSQRPEGLIEDTIRISPDENDAKLKYKLLQVQDNASRVVVLFCTPVLAKRIMDIAYLLGMYPFIKKVKTKKSKDEESNL